VEDAPDRTQPVGVVRLHAPRRQQRAEVGQLIIELFKEHLTDVLVDVFGIVIETGLEAGFGRGAGSGIGRAASLALLADGWSVVLAGRRPEPLEAVAD